MSTNEHYMKHTVGETLEIRRGKKEQTPNTVRPRERKRGVPSLNREYWSNSKSGIIKTSPKLCER